MDSTPHSLLARLRTPADERSRAADWARFVELFAPLLYHWAGRLGLQAEDAADLVQEVFLVLVRWLPEFTPDPQQSFRGWLRTLLRHCWHDRHHRRPALVPLNPSQLEDLPDPDAIDAFAEREFRQHLVQRALHLMQTDFEPATWQACWQTKVCGRLTPEVAAELGLTVAAVHAATYRVLRRLRQELEGFLA